MHHPFVQDAARTPCEEQRHQAAEHDHAVRVQEAAGLSGINVRGTLVRVFALASAIGGLAGFLIAAADEQVTPMLGMWSTLKGMVAMMLGGLGSLPGAVLGGLALGMIEAHAHWFLGPQLRDFLVYLLLFVLLALRPPWMSTRSAS
jgi:branched-subunit amino acid ABC-type transport system permease component